MAKNVRLSKKGEDWVIDSFDWGQTPFRKQYRAVVFSNPQYVNKYPSEARWRLMKHSLSDFSEEVQEKIALLDLMGAIKVGKQLSWKIEGHRGSEGEAREYSLHITCKPKFQIEIAALKKENAELKRQLAEIKGETS